jgi:hypothetical protein
LCGISTLTFLRLWTRAPRIESTGLAAWETSSLVTISHGAGLVFSGMRGESEQRWQEE